MQSSEITYPLNIFDICSHYSNLKIKACDFKTKGLRGMAVLSDESSDINCILVNSNLSYKEQNFHGCHELLHIYLNNNKSGQTFKCYDKVKPFQDAYAEWLANEGAAELMVPYLELLPLIKKDYKNMIQGFGTLEFCSKIAPKFLVSPVVIQNRLNSLSYEIEQYINGTSIRSINILSKSQQKKQNIHIKSLNELENERMIDSLSFFNTTA